MLAGLVLISTLVGFAAVIASFALALPTWMMLLSYPVVCSLTLLLTAALWNIRSVEPRRIEGVLHSQA